MAGESTNIALLRTIYEGYARKDLAPLLAAITDDVRFGIVASRDHLRFAGVDVGRAWLLQVIRTIDEDYEWLEFGLREVISEGDRVVALTGGRVEHRATGTVIPLELADVIKFRDGRIVEFIEYFDTASALALDHAMRTQVGSPPQEAGKRTRKAKARPKAKAKPKAKGKAKASKQRSARRR